MRTVRRGESPAKSTPLPLLRATTRVDYSSQSTLAKGGKLARSAPQNYTLFLNPRYAGALAESPWNQSILIASAGRVAVIRCSRIRHALNETAPAAGYIPDHKP